MLRRLHLSPKPLFAASASAVGSNALMTMSAVRTYYRGSPSAFGGSSPTSKDSEQLKSTFMAGSAVEPPVIVGNEKNGLVGSLSTQCKLNDVVGLSNIGHDVPFRLPAGEVLSLMDLCAARTATSHLRGSKTATVSVFNTSSNNHVSRQEQSSEKGSEQKDIVERPLVSSATVAATDMNFRFPLVNGDTANLLGTIVDVGKSSMTVQVEVYRTQFPHRTRQCVARAFFFMVAINSELKSAPVVPALEVAGPHVALRNAAVAARATQRKEKKELAELLERVDTLAVADFETDINKSKTHFLKMEETTIEANRLFFPGHLNLNNTIFGGEILRWMEMHACHCGRLFTKNKRVFSVGMHDITFSRPIDVDDWVSLEATVVYVQNTTLVVDVTLWVESTDGVKTTNEASFVLTNFDDVGHRQFIDTGLDLQSASLEQRKRYVAAKARYNSHKTATGSFEPPKKG